MSQLTNTVELFERSRTGSSDPRVGTLTRRFLVPTTRDNAWSYPGVPIPGSTFVAAGRTLVCDRIDVDGTPDPNTSEVIASYSSDGRFRFTVKNPTPDETLYARWTFTTSLQSRKIPSFVRKPVIIPGNPPTVEEQWERDDLTLEVSMSNFSSTIILSALDNATINLILSQVGLIHQFGTFTAGTLPYQAIWKFKGFRSNRIAEDKVEVTYDWYTDHGNFGFASSIVASPVIPPPAGDVGFIDDQGYRLVPTGNRYSFQEYLVIPPQEEGQVPGVITYQPYADLIQPDSMQTWKDLPGNPIG